MPVFGGGHSDGHARSTEQVVILVPARILLVLQSAMSPIALGTFGGTRSDPSLHYESR